MEPGGLPIGGRLAHSEGYLRPVPLLRLLHVAGCHCLVLCADLSQGCCEVWLGYIQLHMDLLPGQLLLELPHLLVGVREGMLGLGAQAATGISSQRHAVFCLPSDTDIG